MRALLASEFGRFFGRRIVRAFAVGSLVVALGAGVFVFLASHKDTVAHIRLLEAQRVRAIELCATQGYNPPLSTIALDDRREFCASEGIAAPPFTFHLTQLLDIFQGADFKGTAVALVILSFESRRVYRRLGSLSLSLPSVASFA